MSRPIDIALTPLPALAPRAQAPRPRPVLSQACASGGCGGTPAPARVPAPSFAPVLVNGVEIPAEVIAHEMQHHPAAEAETSWRAAARALALRELLVQEARRLGVDASLDEADQTDASEAEDETLVRRLLETQLRPERADADACLRVYTAESHRFRTPDLFEASHILIEPGQGDADGWREAEARAREIAAAVGNDRDAFVQAARVFSSCPSSRQDGSLGQIKHGDLVPAVQRAIEALVPGTTGPEPVRSRYGWHVLRLERRIEGRILPFEAVQARICDMLEARAWTTASVAYLAGLVRAARIDGIDLEPGIGAAEGAA